MKEKINRVKLKCYCGLNHEISILHDTVTEHNIVQPKNYDSKILKAILKPNVEKILRFNMFELTHNSNLKSLMITLVDLAEGSLTRFNAIISILEDFKKQMNKK